jgi:WD40 repeat protein
MKIKEEKEGVRSMSFLRDITKVLQCIDDSIINVMTLEGRSLAHFKGNTGILSPDGTKVLISVSKDTTIRLFSLEGKPLKVFHGEEPMAFSPDGSKIAINSGDGDRVVQIFNIDGILLNKIQGYGQVVFSPDGIKILTESAKTGVLNLWDSSGNLLYTFEDKQGNSIYTMAFAPDGKKILVSFADNSVMVWNSVMTLEELLKSDKIDELTEEQKKKYDIK